MYYVPLRQSRRPDFSEASFCRMSIGCTHCCAVVLRFARWVSPFSSLSFHRHPGFLAQVVHSAHQWISRFLFFPRFPFCSCDVSHPHGGVASWKGNPPPLFLGHVSSAVRHLSHRCDRHNPGGEGGSWLPLVRVDQPTEETQTYRRNEPSRCTHTCASAHAAGDVERRVRSRMETCNPWKVPRGRKRPPVVEEEDRDRDGHVCSPKATGSNTLAPRNVPKNVRSLRRPPVVRRCVCCPSVDWVKLG